MSTHSFLSLLQILHFQPGQTPDLADVKAAVNVSDKLGKKLVTIMRQPDPNVQPLFALGFGAPSDYVINNIVRIRYLHDALLNPDGFTTNDPCAKLAGNMPSNPLRKAFWINDMRNNNGWIPKAKVRLIGGVRDPQVFFFNSEIMYKYWTCGKKPPSECERL